MQLIKAEERFKDSCRRYKDLYLDLLYFVDYDFGQFIHDTYDKKFDGFVTLSDFKKSYLGYKFKMHSKRNPFTRFIELDKLDKEFGKYIQAVGIPNQTVLLHIKYQRIWSFCFESYNVRSRYNIFDVDETLRHGNEIDQSICLWEIKD